jgi:hypothetical protein
MSPSGFTTVREMRLPSPLMAIAETSSCPMENAARRSASARPVIDGNRWNGYVELRLDRHLLEADRTGLSEPIAEHGTHPV